METENFQHYRILRRDDGSLWELGRGAMAVTYKAFDVNLCCPVALKVVNSLSLEDEHTRARFVREARAAAALRHRNIASVYHLGNDEQSYFYAMEYVDGETVADLVVRRGPLPPAEALGIAAQVARALGAAAKQGLVHRDIKPANVMVVREDEDDALSVKVIDFGLARRAVTDQSAQITLSGFVGTPQYASPEQVAERDLDSRSDIYSLGVTLWFMLTGQPTFTGPPARIGAHHLSSEPPWGMLAHVPEPVRDLLARMLQKDPANRPQTPPALRHEIEACLETLETGLPTNPTPVAAVDTPTVITATGPSGGGGTTAAETPVAVPPAIPSAIPPDDETAVDLPRVEAAVVSAAPPPPTLTPEGPPPEVGEIFAGRYSLLEFVGEGRAGQVFRTQDTKAGRRTTALKILRPELPLGKAEFQELRADLLRLRAAPHPRLIEVFALDQSHGYGYVAQEWVNGFTLVDLLRQRGRLDLLEALHLLEQASNAAAHGSAHGFGRLELSPHQTLVHFPEAFVGDAGRAVRAIIEQPLSRWPIFGLKIDALAPTHESGHASTWVGAMTLVPSARAPERTRAAGPGLLAGGGGYFHALGALLYELLSGAPLPYDQEGNREVPPLPTLNEEANEVLERALSAAPDFRDEKELFNALLAACGLEREDLRFGAEPAPAAVVVVAAPMPAAVPPPLPPPPPRRVDATIVPSAIAVTSPFNKTFPRMPPAPPAAIRMAPTIRTKLLRPRGTGPTAGTPARTAGPGGMRLLLVIAVLVGIAVAVLVLVLVLRSRGLPPFSRQPSPTAPPAVRKR